MKKLIITLFTSLMILMLWTQQLYAATALHAVLAYSGDIGNSALLAGTNAQREAYGESDLALNAQLGQAAQAKANDMVAENYWSHYSPSGVAPWAFIAAAGYDYQAAGENLACGYDNASDVITAWMNSPEHRANVLKADFADVGFGVASSADFVGNGPETIIVAEYGTPVAAPVPSVTPAPVNPPLTAAAPAPAEQTDTTPVAVPATDTSTPASTVVSAHPAAPHKNKPKDAAHSAQKIFWLLALRRDTVLAALPPYFLANLG